MNLMIVACFLLYGFRYFKVSGAYGVSPSIPEHLLNCYRRDYLRNHESKPPMTAKLLVELIRKVELAEKNSLDLRMFTTSILHGVRFDGVRKTPGVEENEFSIPYRASGRQFNKYKLLVGYLTSGKAQLTPYSKINIEELCLLHEAISNTVHVWKSVNEGRPCPEWKSMSYQSFEGIEKQPTFELNKCPIEGGVVKTRWGTVSPGHVIAGIASALQLSTLPLKELIEVIQEDKAAEPGADSTVTKTTAKFSNLGNVNNVDVATLAGDLAEVTVWQAFKTPQIGNQGKWNDTYVPRLLHLQNRPFDMTDAELLGGIDGLVIAKKIKQWSSTMKTLRLSQILEMYYSKRGVIFENNFRACNRKSLLKEVLVNMNLEQSTENAAKLLFEIGGANQYLDEEGLEKYAVNVSRKFQEEAEIVTARYEACEQDVEQVQPLEMMVILDDSWKEYEAHMLLGALAQGLDVGIYGSSLGIVNGHSARWITNVSDSVVKLYEDLRMNEGNWDMQFQLAKSLQVVNSHLQNQSTDNCQDNRRIPRTPIILVMANSAVLSESQQQDAETVVRAIKNLYPETRIKYVASPHNLEGYRRLARLYPSDDVLQISDYGEVLISGIAEKLSSIPSRLTDYYCSNSQIRWEDYVTPGKQKIYEIHAEYQRRSNFEIKFKGNNYGEAQVCVYETTGPANKLCKGITGNEEIQFNSGNYCASNYSCSVKFSLEVTKAKTQCSELDCRYPDQFRVVILTSWTSKSSAATHLWASSLFWSMVPMALTIFANRFYASFLYRFF